ncbi:MAG: hypothetical protein V1701_02615 [Planctomycetota bacterium]
MPKKIYQCNICHTEYDTEEAANNCEAQPVINPHNIKEGDEIILRNCPEHFVGLAALVEEVRICPDHHVEVRASFDDVEYKERRREWFYSNQYVKFIDASMPEIAEKLGEAVHNLWMAKRKAEKGWHAPEKCPENNFREGSLCYKCCFWLGKSINEFKCSKSMMGYKEFVTKENCPSFSWKMCSDCHPCMRPYSELPDSEKELDRAYPAEFFRILDGMGYMVTVKPKTNT